MFTWTPTQIIDWLRDKPVDKKFKIKAFRKKRTLDQNAYLHKLFEICAVIMNKEYGHDYWNKEKVKEFFKAEFIQEDTIEIKWKEFTYKKGTADMDTKEMTDFIQNMKAWMLDWFQIVLPDPDDDKLLDWIDNFSW